LHETEVLMAFDVVHRRRLGPGFGGTKDPQFGVEIETKLCLSLCIL